MITSPVFHEGHLPKFQQAWGGALPGWGRWSSFLPSVVHEQLPVQLLVTPGGLHGVQQLLGLDELWVPLSIFWPGHQAPDVCSLPLDFWVHRGCRDRWESWSELALQSHPSLWPQLKGKGFGVRWTLATCYCAALGRLADFLSLSLLFCEIEIIEPVHRVVVWFVKWVVMMFVKWGREVKCYLVTK